MTIKLIRAEPPPPPKPPVTAVEAHCKYFPGVDKLVITRAAGGDYIFTFQVRPGVTAVRLSTDDVVALAEGLAVLPDPALSRDPRA